MLHPRPAVTIVARSHPGTRTRRARSCWQHSPARAPAGELVHWNSAGDQVPEGTGLPRGSGFWPRRKAVAPSSGAQHPLPGEATTEAAWARPKGEAASGIRGRPHPQASAAAPPPHPRHKLGQALPLPRRSLMTRTCSCGRASRSARCVRRWQRAAHPPSVRPDGPWAGGRPSLSSPCAASGTMNGAVFKRGRRRPRAAAAGRGEEALLAPQDGGPGQRDPEELRAGHHVQATSGGLAPTCVCLTVACTTTVCMAHLCNAPRGPAWQHATYMLL